jgi:hypothetical protein
MDALTSFELEAQRRRETVANDRDHGLARANASTEPVETDTAPWAVRGARTRPARAAQGDCQPAPLARNAIG